MIYRFNAVKSVTDPLERARRLVQLYSRFENTSVEDVTRQDAPPTEAEASQPLQANRPADFTPRRQNGQNGGDV